MTPVTKTPEFKPSGTVPATKGAVDKALETQREKFKEGLQRASRTEEQNAKIDDARKWATDKLAEINQKRGDGYGKGGNEDSLKDFLGKAYTATSPLTRYYNTERSNKKILDHSLKGIRDKYRASQKSMPVSKP